MDESYRSAAGLQEGKRYALRFSGIQKSPRSLLVRLNGVTQSVEAKDGLFYFTPASLLGMNEISVVLDEVVLNPLKLPKLNPMPWLSILLN